MRLRPLPGTVGLVSAIICVSASPAQAHCGKDVTELLKFAIGDVSASFDAWNAAAEQFCPNVFITRDVPAKEQEKEVWTIKFDEEQSGTDADAVAVEIIDKLSPMLKLNGYQDKPSGGYAGMGIQMNWDAPSKPHVRVEVVVKDKDDYDDDPGKTLYEVEVWHRLN